MGNSLRRSEAAGQKTVLSECAHHGRFDIFLVAALASVAVVDMLLHNHPCRNDFQLVDDFFPNLRQFPTALGADQLLSFQPVLNLFYRNILRDLSSVYSCFLWRL